MPIKNRNYMNEAPAVQISVNQSPLFPNLDEMVLANCIATYQKLGCWTPHVEFKPQAPDAVMDGIEYLGALKERYRHDQVFVASPLTTSA
jgi:NitT/TauT family transport system substrate-binding protein